jgi:methyl coenzyme M reductase subunit C-like uncharacterized protein (methanogenesis marker protein 7)
MSNLVGNFTLTEDAMDWGTEWYENFHRNEAPKLDASLIGGYIARKQTLVHKVAMTLSVSQGDSLVITRQLLERAVLLLTELEKTMPLVYSQIGVSPDAQAGDDVIAFLKRYGGKAPFTLLYRAMHKNFPNPDRFDQILMGLRDAGLIGLSRETGLIFLTEGAK